MINYIEHVNLEEVYEELSAKGWKGSYSDLLKFLKRTEKKAISSRFISILEKDIFHLPFNLSYFKKRVYNEEKCITFFEQLKVEIEGLIQKQYLLKYTESQGFYHLEFYYGDRSRIVYEYEHNLEHYLKISYYENNDKRVIKHIFNDDFFYHPCQESR